MKVRHRNPNLDHGIFIAMITDPEFHRRRAEIEMQKALEAGHPSTAMVHLELARMHREKRDALARELRLAIPACPCPIDRTDKEC